MLACLRFCAQFTACVSARLSRLSLTANDIFSSYKLFHQRHSLVIQEVTKQIKSLLSTLATTVQLIVVTLNIIIPTHVKTER